MTGSYFSFFTTYFENGNEFLNYKNWFFIEILYLLFEFYIFYAIYVGPPLKKNGIY